MLRIVIMICVGIFCTYAPLRHNLYKYFKNKVTKGKNKTPPTNDKPKIDEAKIDKAKIDKANIDKAKIDKTKIDKKKVDKATLIEQIEDKPTVYEQIVKKQTENKPTIDETSITESNANEANITKPKFFFKSVFLSRESLLCRYHLYTLENCGKSNCPVGCLRDILDALQTATCTIQICMYKFSLTFLRDAIIDAIQRGVTVQIITDISGDREIKELMLKFFEYILMATEMKSINVYTHYSMHNKFAIIDNSLLVTGSANWTWSAFFGNSENLIFTNDQDMIKNFQKAFNNMWDVFGGNAYEGSLLIKRNLNA